MNLNLSASLNIFKLLAKPSLCLPHATVATFDDLPIPLSKAFATNGRQVDIRAVVLDKDDCFATPDHNEVYAPYKVILLLTCHVPPFRICFPVYAVFFLAVSSCIAVLSFPVALLPTFHEPLAKLRSLALRLCERPTRDAVF